MHVHNTVNVYVNLLLHLSGIKVIGRYMFIVITMLGLFIVVSFDLSSTKTFTKYSRKKELYGSNTC